MKNTLILLTCVIAYSGFSFSQEPIKFVPVEKFKDDPETKFHIADHLSNAVSVGVHRNSLFIAKTNENGWIALPNLQKGDTLVFGLNSQHIPLTYIVPVASPAEPVYLNLSAPPPPPPSEKFTERIIETIEEPASYPGGRAAMMKFLADNLKYPEKAVEEGIEGKCYVRFIIDVDGTVSNVKITRGIPDSPECDQEAIRVVEKMPQWEPGKIHGKAVKSYFDLVVPFKLN